MGLDNLKVNVEVGKKGMEKLIDVLVDTFSPASETLGLLGDAVRLARVDVAATIARKAKALADEHGFKLKAPPLKFLVPFVEKASIEDLGDATLVDMWAKLLAAAGSNYNARHQRYTALLSEMSGDQARILQSIARNYGGVVGIDIEDLALVYDFIPTRIARLLGNLEESVGEKILERVLKLLCHPGISIVYIYFHMKLDDANFEWARDEVYADRLSVDFEILQSFGLLNRVDLDQIEAKHAVLHLTYYRMTELGCDFWSACCGTPKFE